jgi:hypothetical protein
MSAKAALQVAERAGGEMATPAGPDRNEDVQAFLGALATLLRDTVLRFEETVGRITTMIVPNGGRRADRELIVTLQNFDRLQQEFAALGDALARYASMTSRLSVAENTRHQVGREVIAEISIADLKERFLRELQGDAADFMDPANGDEEIF